MSDVISARQPGYKSMTVREKHREWAIFGVMGVLTMGLVGALITSLVLYVQMTDPGIHRSEGEMISGGKRFIDGFFSLNSGTIDRDQFRAINMIVVEDRRNEELKKLAEKDLIRLTQESGMQSRIGWVGSEVNVLEVQGEFMEIQYKAHLIRNERDAYPLDIVLTLMPVEKTDLNTDGVGVINWVEISENPFEVKNEK